jgi:hypothetical protein
MGIRDVGSFMQSLRGSESSILLVYLIMRQALTVAELRTCTGLDDDTVRAAVKGLAAKGLLYKQTGRHGRATWLPAGDTFFGRLFAQNPRISDSGSATTTTRLEGERDLLVVAAVDSRQSPKTSDSVGAQNPNFSDSDEREIRARWDANLRACFRVGIGQPKAGSISRLEWVDPDFIAAHVADLGEGQTIGLAIRRIESNELPRSWAEAARVAADAHKPRKKRELKRVPGRYFLRKALRAQVDETGGMFADGAVEEALRHQEEEFLKRERGDF